MWGDIIAYVAKEYFFFFVQNLYFEKRSQSRNYVLKNHIPHQKTRPILKNHSIPKGLKETSECKKVKLPHTKRTVKEKGFIGEEEMWNHDINWWEFLLRKKTTSSNLLYDVVATQNENRPWTLPHYKLKHTIVLLENCDPATNHHSKVPPLKLVFKTPPLQTNNQPQRHPQNNINWSSFHIKHPKSQQKIVSLILSTLLIKKLIFITNSPLLGCHAM